MRPLFAVIGAVLLMLLGGTTAQAFECMAPHMLYKKAESVLLGGIEKTKPGDDSTKLLFFRAQRAWKTKPKSAYLLEVPDEAHCKNSKIAGGDCTKWVKGLEAGKQIFVAFQMTNQPLMTQCTLVRLEDVEENIKAFGFKSLEEAFDPSEEQK